MTQQLRLVEPAKTQSRHAPAPARPSRRARDRRAVIWGEWALDPRTRRVGRAGVAAARRALDEAARNAQTVEERRRAS